MKVPHLWDEAFGARSHPSSFYVDCRLYRPTYEEAEYNRRSLAADKVLPLPSDVPAKPQAIPPKPKGLMGKLTAMGKDLAQNAVSEFFGSAGGKGDPDLPRQCSELYGLFQRKNIMEAPTDATLRVNIGVPKGLADLEDDKAPGGLFIQHTTSHQWYHCFILGKKEEAQLQCVAMEPDEIFKARGTCGVQACDFDRVTFKTECLTRVVGLMGRPQCVYVGHHMELHPKDIMGKPAPYSVYILQCPLLAPPGLGQRSRDRGKAFLEVQSDRGHVVKR